MFKIAAAGLCALAFSVASHASPITITQTYSNVTFYEYGEPNGVTYGHVPTGDWIFTGTVDSNAVKQSSPYPEFATYQLSSLTVTQASLGLSNVAITNVPELFFYPDRFGFAATQDGAPPWTVMVYEPGHFANGLTLQQDLDLLTNPTSTDPYTSFGPQWTGFDLADGRTLYGWGFGPATVSVSAVPEPGTLPLMLVALAPLAWRLKRRAAR